MDKKKVLITGGAGFIGSALVSELSANEAYELFVIDNLSFGNRAFIPQIDEQHFFEEDILNKEKLNQLVQSIQPNWVIHLAAIHFIPYCNQHPFESSDINISGSANLIEAIKTVNSVERVFFSSTAAVYPIYDDPITEEHAVGPMDIYGVAKLAGEYIFKSYYQETKTPTVICRFFNAFGPNETNPHLIPEIEQQIKEGKRIINLGNLDPKRDFIHTSDMAVAVRKLMEHSAIACETVNLGRQIEYSVREIVEAFERQLGEKIEINVDPEKVRKTDRMHLLADITKLKKLTDWSPQRDIDSGIKTLLENE